MVRAELLPAQGAEPSEKLPFGAFAQQRDLVVEETEIAVDAFVVSAEHVSAYEAGLGGVAAVESRKLLHGHARKSLDIGRLDGHGTAYRYLAAYVIASLGEQFSDGRESEQGHRPYDVALADGLDVADLHSDVSGRVLSLEEMLEITGNVSFAGHLERIAFNALPTQITDDFMGKQYFQQPNQVKITRHTRNFYEEGSHGGTDIVYGTLTGYPCCVSNMHQGWPKFVQNLWYATADDGIAALVYSPSEVTAKVGNGCTVRITEDTYYPMDQQIKFTVSILDKGVDGIAFPFHLRIPEWSRDAAVKINGEKVRVEVKDGIVVLNRIWKNGDIVELDFPMEVAVSRWYDGAVAVERGPLVYGLYMEELWTKRNFGKEEIKRYGESYYEVTSDTKWNYGIPVSVADNIKDAAKVEIDPVKVKNTYPWNLKNAPIRIKLKAKEIPNWTLYNETAGPIPFSVYPVNTPETEITLIPYGCTTLRISEFPLTW